MTTKKKRRTEHPSNYKIKVVYSNDGISFDDILESDAFMDFLKSLLLKP